MISNIDLNPTLDADNLNEYMVSMGYGPQQGPAAQKTTGRNSANIVSSSASNQAAGTTTIRLNDMHTYINGVMQNEMTEFSKSGNLKSGYGNLDAITNIYPGLYFIGAISSLGKTTFVHQMADQMAERGQQVLYFSLEQSTLELATKSLARIQAKKNRTTAMTSLQIRKQGSDSRVADAILEYSKYSGNLTAVECSFRATVDDIASCINDFIQTHKQKPVVMIDYLQVIQAPKDSRLSTKDLIDSIVRRLKEIQEDHKLAMIVVSSLNRQNYMSLVDFESFKETGGIEYTADVVWGLQLQVLHDEIFDKGTGINEKREKIRNAKAATPRKVELVCLKNRFGISSYTCKFDYYAANDYFVPDMNGIDMQAYETVAEKDPDGFQKLPAELKTPFD